MKYQQAKIKLFSLENVIETEMEKAGSLFLKIFHVSQMQNK
jgi:hypothetical protein